MKRVVFLVPSLGMGGMERVLVNYANLFVKRGYDVTVLNFTYDDPGIVNHFDERVHYVKNYAPVKNLFHVSLRDILRFNFRLLPWERWLRLHSPAFLHKRYMREPYDIEIAFFGVASLKIVSGADCSVSAIGWLHNVNVEADIKPLGGYQKAKFVYNGVPKLICVSERSKQKVEEVFGREHHLYVVNNPNDTLRIRKLAGETLPITKEKFTFAVVARFDDHQKGFKRLFNVCKKLNEEGFDNYTIWLVGDGIDYNEIREKAVTLHLDNIIFIGKKDNPYPYISQADMYLCSSYFEGFSMVMMEAVILGKPMLTTDVSGAAEMLGDGEYGMIVENSEEGLYNGMKEILSDPGLYKHYCQKAEERKDYLSEEKIMDQVEAILED